MPSFDSDTVTLPEAVTFDFTGFGVDAAGSIPEPSEKQIRDFFRTIKSIYDGDDSDVAEFDNPLAYIDIIDKTSEEEFAAMKTRVLDAVAALCSNTPTAEQMGQLPSYVAGKFFTYVFQAFTNPEGRTAASKPSPEGRSGGDSTTSSDETSASQ